MFPVNAFAANVSVISPIEKVGAVISTVYVNAFTILKFDRLPKSTDKSSMVNPV